MVGIPGGDHKVLMERKKCPKTQEKLEAFRKRRKGKEYEDVWEQILDHEDRDMPLPPNPPPSRTIGWTDDENWINGEPRSVVEERQRRRQRLFDSINSDVVHMESSTPKVPFYDKAGFKYGTAILGVLAAGAEIIRTIKGF